MSAELGDRSDVGGLLSICMQREAFGDLPNEDLEVVSEVLAGQSLGWKSTLPSSEAEAIRESLKGLLRNN